MDRQELIDNLGTVARSGTRAFMSKLAEAKDGAGLIGQFGVGFYSAFMVADRIAVTSRRAGSSEAFTWTSTGGAGFEIAPASEEAATRVKRGTEIVLHMKDDAKKYLESYEIRRVVSTYSDHILFPIELVEPQESGEPKSEKINSASALWQRPKSELKPEDYKQAYQTVAHAFDEPAMTLHYRAEGRLSYAVLLVRAFAAALRPVRSGAQGTRQALRAARLHHRRRGFAAILAALHPRRGRLRGPAAQHLARDAAEQSAGRRDAQGDHRPRRSPSWKALPRRTPRHSARSGTRSGRCSRKASTRITRSASAAQARALRHHRRQGAHAQAIHRRPQAEPDRDLLSGRRKRRAAEIQSEAGGGARARHRGAAALRPSRCVLDHDAERLRGQAAQVAEQGRGRFQPRAAARRGQEGRSETGRGGRDRRGDRDRGGQACARRTRVRCDGLVAARRQPGVPGGSKVRARSGDRTADGAAKSRRRREADPRTQHEARAGARDRQRAARRRTRAT